MVWHAITDSLPPKGEEVLFLWTYPDNAEVRIVRLGSMFHQAYHKTLGTAPVCKIEIDLGDASCMFFTDKDDAPTHWHELPTLPGENA